MKLLVLATDPVGADDVRSALPDADLDGAEVLVVSPAVNESPVAFWVSDSDEAIAKAHEVEEETVERLAEEGIDAAGDTGEGDPLLALGDALATFEADRIVVFTHPGEDQSYREDELTPEAERRFGVPVVHSVVSR
jgi:hypothetical protein